MSRLLKPFGALSLDQTGQDLYHHNAYPNGFFHWLGQNQHIWNQFEIHANTMSAKRNRYSARTIIEVMRWNSDIREKNKLFKLSNNKIPGLARMWMIRYGKDHPKFFQINQ